MNKLNNHGQTLIMFVILLPIMLVLLALVVDISYMYREKNKLENTTKTIIKELYYHKQDDDIKNKVVNLYKKNKINIDNVTIKITDDYFIVNNNYEIDSIFGKIIGLKKYKVKVSFKGYMIEDQIKFTKE